MKHWRQLQSLLCVVFLWGPATTLACDLIRDLQFGKSVNEIKRQLGTLPLMMEIPRCSGVEISLPAGMVCKKDIPGVRDAHLVLHFTDNKLSGWQLNRRGDKMELLTYAEKRLGPAKNKPQMQVARPWANLHWQGTTWQASYVGQGNGKEVVESWDYWQPASLNHPTPRPSICEKE